MDNGNIPGSGSAEKKLQIPNADLLEECRRLLDSGQTVLITAKGGSMFPFIKDGDRVIVCRTGKLEEGDIVLGQTGGQRYVLHRIIGTTAMNCRKVYVLMGDANLKKTEECEENDIAGKVVGIMRNGRTIAADSPAEKFKGRIWMCLRPFRRILLKLSGYRQH